MTEPKIAAVAPLRNGLPSLQDMAGWLRVLADRLEAAKDQDVRTLLIVTETIDGRIQPPHCFGDNPSRSEVVGILTRAAKRADDGSWD